MSSSRFDLFRDVSSRPSSSRFPRRAVVAASIAAHAIVFLAALFYSLSAPGLLPVPRTALAFFDTDRRVQLLDVGLPAPSHPVTTSHAAPTSAIPEAADPPPASTPPPVIAPTGISRESGLEGLEAVTAITRPSNLTSIENSGSSGFTGDVAHLERPALASQTPVRLHSGIREPLALSRAEPIYPALAQSARVQGVVILEAIIDASGRVESVQVLRSIPMLDQAALTAVRQWRYSPAMLNGSPVPVIVTITVTFAL